MMFGWSIRDLLSVEMSLVLVSMYLSILYLCIYLSMYLCVSPPSVCICPCLVYEYISGPGVSTVDIGNRSHHSTDRGAERVKIFLNLPDSKPGAKIRNVSHIQAALIDILEWVNIRLKGVGT